MLSFLKRLFVPTRFDACCLVIVIHWLTVLITVTAIPMMNVQVAPFWLEPINAVAALTWVAIAASICWHRNDRSRTLLLFCSSLASLACVHAWFWLDPEIMAAIEDSQVVGTGEAQQLDSRIWSAIWPIVRNALMAFAVWPLCLLLRYIAGYAMRPFRALSKQFQTDRTRTLFVIAAILFVLALASRINFSFSSQIGFGSNEANNLFARLLAAVFSATIALLWFPRSYSSSGRPFQKLASVVLVMAVVVVSVTEMPSAFNAEAFIGALAIALSGLTFVCSVIGINGSESAITEMADHVPRRSIAFRPSIVSLFTTLFFAAAIAIPMFVDLGVFSRLGSTMIYSNRSATFEELFDLGVQSAKARWDSGGRVSYSVARESFDSIWVVQFKGSDRTDLLTSLPKNGINGVEFNELTPEFDVSCVEGKIGFLLLKNCKVSTSQLNELLGLVSMWGIEGSLTIVDDGTPVSPGVISAVSFMNADPGVANNFLEFTQCTSQLSWMTYVGEINNQDWPAIVGVAQKCRVQLQAVWAPDFKLPPQTLPLGRIYCYSPTNEPTNNAFRKELLLNTDMWIHLPKTYTLPGADVPWKMWMLRGTYGSRSFDDLFQEHGGSLDEFAREIGMAYEVDDNSIDSLYFPDGVSVTEVSKLKQLRVLSFDPSWVRRSAQTFGFFGGPGSPTNIVHLKSLTSLEELYFGPSFIPNNLFVLEKLTSLKHLQIPSVVRKVTGDVGFDACQSLESITFLGVPDDQSYREISKLQKLKKLTIVDVNFDDRLTAEYIEKLKGKFPRAKVTVLKHDDFGSLVPKPFQEYRDRFREELRADTKWMDDLFE